MIEFFLSLIILLIVVAGMAVGVMKGRAPISGSCGGLNNAGIEGGCDICGRDVTKCINRNESLNPGKQPETS